MKQIIAPALAAVLLAGCHPHAGPLDADRQPVVLNGTPMSSIAGPAQAAPGELPTGAAPATLFAAYIDEDVTPLLAAGDRPHVELALIRAFNSRKGEQVIWSNSLTGSHGFVMPHDHANAPGGCRTMHMMTSASGQRAWTYQRACRESDGTWARVAP